MSSNTRINKRTREGCTYWPYETEKIFVSLMYGEFVDGQLLGTTFTPSIWADICLALNGRQHGMTYTVDQCKGKMGRMKLIWRKLIKLREKTGFGYDAASGKFTAEQERWDRLALEDPELFSCKDVRLANMDMLTEMWSTRVATGANARPSTQAPRETSLGSSTREDEGSPSVPGPTREAAGPSRPTSIRRSMTSRRSGRSSGRTDKLDEMVDSFTSANSEKSQRRTMTNAEIDQVYDALKALGVPMTHFTAAINSLQTHEMRYFFLKMTDPEKLAWVMSLL